MTEPYCVELEEPEESSYDLGWFVRALRTEMGVDYYLTINGTVEADAPPSKYFEFYFNSEQEALDTMEQYFEDWNEPFTYQSSSNKANQILESQKMKFI